MLDFGLLGLELEEFRHVEPEREGQDGDDVVHRGPDLGVVVKRMANREVPNDRKSCMKPVSNNILLYDC